MREGFMSALHSTFHPKWSKNIPGTVVWLPLLCSLLSVLTTGTYLLKHIRKKVSRTGCVGEWPEWQKQMSSHLNNVDHFISLWPLLIPPSPILLTTTTSSHHWQQLLNLIHCRYHYFLNFKWGNTYTCTHTFSFSSYTCWPLKLILANAIHFCSFTLHSF